MSRPRFIILQSVGLCLLIVAVMAGLFQQVVLGDKTHMAELIFGVFSAGVVAVFLQKWEVVDYLSETCVFLGLLGTVIGFIVAFSAVNPGVQLEDKDVVPLVTKLVYGMSTAFYATLTGGISYTWLQFSTQVLRRDAA